MAKTMAQMMRDMRLLAVFALAPLVSGCGLIPPEGPSLLAQRPKIESGPSAQRLGPDGYPQLGAFPKSAATQLTDRDVATNRTSLQSAATSQNAAAAPASANYRRQVAESQAVQAATRRDVDKAVAAARGADVAIPDGSDAVLRTIEGR